MAEAVDLTEVSEKEALEVLRKLHHVDEPEARFMLAVMKGEIQSDVLDLHKGKPA